MRFSIINEDTLLKCAQSNAKSIYKCSNGTEQFVMVDDGSKWAMFKSTDFSLAILSSSTTDTSCLDPNLSSYNVNRIVLSAVDKSASYSPELVT